MDAKPNLFILHFSELKDPRLARKRHHSLLDIIAITVCAVIAGADGWTDVEAFGKAKKDWLSTFLKLPNGIPSHDTFGRFFSLLDPVAFQTCFIRWVQALHEHVQGVVAIDGKTARRSHDKANGKQAIHVVSAWATENGIALGQVKVDDKSNEITAIPELLKVLQLNGCLITIDAMGCQREIAQDILDAGADYLLAVKGNQETLAADMEEEFKTAQADGFAHMEHQYYETVEKGHGRMERRQYWYTHDVEGLGTLERWPQLRGMAMCRAARTLNGETTIEDRYFITSSTDKDVKKIAASIRAHWRVENCLHWVLDVAFNEDQCRIRIGYAAENLAAIRRLAINVIKNNKGKKGGIKAKRLQAAWDNDYLHELFMAMPAF
jgi:predicted transposase YbfD/YdcC